MEMELIHLFTKFMPLLNAIVLSFLVACSAPPQKNVALSTLSSDPFVLVGQLHESSNPFIVYEEAMPTFRFRSTATLEELSGKTSESLTVFEQIERKYLHIWRKPFEPVPSVEILQLEGLIYLRPHLEQTFYQIKKNPELVHLQKTIFSETLTYFDLDELKKAPQETTETQECYQAQQTQICFDPVTHLPIFGKTKQNQGHQAVLHLEFSVEPLEEDFVRKEPEKIHSLRFSL